MDGFIDKPGQKCPADDVNFVNKFFFWWIKDTFKTAGQRDLEMRDMCYPMKRDEAERSGVKLERAWARELKKLKNTEYTPSETTGKKKIIAGKGPNLCRAIFVVFWWDYLKCGLQFFAMNIVLKTMQPLFQKEIIGYFSGSGAETVTTKRDALLYAGGLIATTLASISLQHHVYTECYQVAMRARVACGALIYAKILRLSNSALSTTTPGQIVNLLSNDLNRFDIVGPLLHKLWLMPIQVIVIGACLYLTIGPIGLIGIGTLIFLTVPLQFVFIRWIKSLRRKVAALSDHRIQLMAELVNGIQIVKMYAWERTFGKVVSNARESEMGAIRTVNYLRTFLLSMPIFTDKFNLFATLVTYVLLGNVLTAEVIFTTALYYTILQNGSVFTFPMAVLQTGEVAVSIERLQNFLLLEECEMAEAIQADEDPKDQKAASEYDAASLNETRSSTLMASSTDIVSLSVDETIRGLESEEDPSSAGNSSRLPTFLEIERLSANWHKGQMPPTLCDVSLKIYGGELCGLVGQVGSGKSSLLNVILRELPIGSGNLYMRRNIGCEDISGRRGYVSDNPDLVISYASQAPWLITDTVRNNILFGQAWNAQRYQEVTRVCALWRDIQQWPEGDSTIVGDRGIALSGGQKARVNLARAVYKDADVYLLDDPLSAVDNRVGKHLFKKCINGYLRGKTRILVTHQLHYLKSVDTIVVLDRGLVRAQGTFEDLSKSNAEFVSLLNKQANAESEKKKETPEAVRGEARKEGNTNVDDADMKRWASIGSIDSMSLDWTNESDMSSGASSQNSEMSPKGSLSWKVWRRYFRTGGSPFALTILVIGIFIGQLSLTLIDLWLAYWSNVEAVRTSLYDPGNGVTPAEYLSSVNNTVFSYFDLLDEDGLLSTDTAIYIYAGLIACCIVFNLARNLAFMRVCVRTSYRLHDNMFRNVLRAPMKFFTQNQSGRIVNRFSKDVGFMDELLPSAMLDASRVMLLMIGVFATIIVTNVWMLLPTVVMIPVFFWLTARYLTTAYSIKRLEETCKSPMFTQVITTLQGIATIRSSGPQIARVLRKQFNNYQDIHSGALFLCVVSTAFFSLWLDLLTTAFIACVCFTPILIYEENIFGGTVGLTISQSMMLCGMLQYGVKQCAETAVIITAVERICQYADIETEKSLNPSDPPPPDWPTQGRLTMKNVFMSYTDDDTPVLKDLSVRFEPGWKVGVVGRTGAGKSSLISAIFRLENDGLRGEIKIDGRDTSTLVLEDLRSRISIIPQESVLFSGTLRHNLDPFGLYEDAALLDALKEVELGGLYLEQKVSEDGANFSVGQRQLICLARAILKNNRILVLDEATANIDARTDALIQKTLKTKFARYTVITVAHRLVTVVESDRILVMENGRVAEFGCPYELLQNNPDGPFAKMVQQAGPAAAEDLMRLAEAACLEVPAHHSLDLDSTNSDGSPVSNVRNS